jgi:hypothetical protein
VFLLSLVAEKGSVVAGRGVRPCSVACPCCLSRIAARSVSAPGCGVPSMAVGVFVSCLAWLLVAPGRPLAFPRLVCFFPFVLL